MEGRGSSRRASVALRLALLSLGLAVAVVVVATQTDSVTGLLDLRIYLGASASLRSGGSIYAFSDPTYGLGSTYPPLWALLLWPVSGANVHVVEYVWTTVGVVLWLVTLELLATPVGGRPFRGPDPLPGTGVCLVWLATLFSAPVWNTLNQGQINVALWLLLVIDLRLVLRGRAAAGVAAGTAAALKLWPLMAVVLYAGARRWRAATLATLTFVLLTAASALVVPDDARRFWTELVGDTGRVGGLGDPQSSSLRSVLERTGLPAALGTATWAVLAVVVVVLAVAAFRRALQQRAIITAATVLGCAAALVSPISWTHHLVFLCFPLLLVLPAPGARPSVARVALAVGMVVALVDPVGWGRLAVTSDLRALAMVVLLGAAPWLAAVEAGHPAVSPRSDVPDVPGTPDGSPTPS